MIETPYTVNENLGYMGALTLSFQGNETAHLIKSWNTTACGMRFKPELTVAQMKEWEPDDTEFVTCFRCRGTQLFQERQRTEKD